MRDFILQLTFMCLGGVLVQVIRAIRLVPSGEFSARTFLLDPKNYQRFALLFIGFATIQALLVLEGQFILDALKQVGLVLPSAASSVVGFILTWAAFAVRRFTE